MDVLQSGFNEELGLIFRENFGVFEMSKKRVLNFECPNCKATNQDRFLAEYEDDKPIIRCTKCDSKFSSRVIERIYYKGLSDGKKGRLR